MKDRPAMRLGMAQLHELFNEEISMETIRAYYAPEVRVIEQVATEKTG